MSEYILEMIDINKSFPGVKALDNAQLKVRPGTVHALMGENGAGKSTLMKCLYGMYFADSGQIILDGDTVNFKDSKEALDHGVAMIHQELQPIRMMTVGENIFLGNYPLTKLGLVDHDKMYKETVTYLEDVGLAVDPKTLLNDLTVSQMQSVEIAKAISHNAKVVIMDEPTSSLTETEVAKLFDIINDLRSQNIAIIYISHKMKEILEISDEVTILRDGQYVGTWAASELDTDKIIKYMVGRELVSMFPPRTSMAQDETILEISDFSSPAALSFKNCSFSLKKGEILGVGGLVGAQRTELMEAIYGIRLHQPGGCIKKDNVEITINRPQDAIKNGIALVTEDRRDSGIFAVLSVSDNVAIASVDQYRHGPLLNLKEIDEIVEKSIEKLSIKTPTHKTPIGSLSGGNQQKAILARWLANAPDILILDEPTRGIDVGAKYEIYEIIGRLVEEGKSVIMITSEMAELLGLSDRIMVMCEGKIAGFLDAEEASQEKVMALATKFMVKNQEEPDS
ncbi:MAG: sugar ABC transporter ATP-binding protein [Saccharofermentanales bacterium]